MNKIIKWLTDNGIEFTTEYGHHGMIITITLEEDCIWVNGFGKDMHYARTIRVFQDTYKKYEIIEKVGYASFHALFRGGKADNAIEILTKRFDKEA